LWNVRELQQPRNQKWLWLLYVSQTSSSEFLLLHRLSDTFMLCIHLSTFLNNLSNSVKCALNIDLLLIFCRRTMINRSISSLVYFTSNAKLLKKMYWNWTVEKSRIIEFALFYVTSTAKLFDQGDSLYREEDNYCLAICYKNSETANW